MEKILTNVAKWGMAVTQILTDVDTLFFRGSGRGGDTTADNSSKNSLKLNFIKSVPSSNGQFSGTAKLISCQGHQN